MQHSNVAPLYIRHAHTETQAERQAHSHLYLYPQPPLIGSLSRVVLPPSRSIALVEFVSSSHATKAFKALAYTKFKHVPLYLGMLRLSDIHLFICILLIHPLLHLLTCSFPSHSRVGSRGNLCSSKWHQGRHVGRVWLFPIRETYIYTYIKPLLSAGSPRVKRM